MIRIGVRSFVAGGTSYVGILDTYTNAAAAYSVRLLRSAYTGSAIRVRRSSDNTEQDIGFTSLGNLDESALTTFVGAGNGFVTTWYDQSGNGHNLAQSTALNQPQIVGSGTVLKRNSKPILQTDGNSFLTNSTIPSWGSVNSIFCNLYLTSTRGNVAMMSSFNTSQNQHFPSRETNGTNRYYDSLSNITASALPTALNLISIFENSGVLNVWENNAQLVNNGTADTGTATGLYLFRRGVGANLPNGYGIPEVIIYSSNQLSNRAGINSNINTYFSIY
jgi:hypothetical protein